MIEVLIWMLILLLSFGCGVVVFLGMDRLMHKIQTDLEAWLKEIMRQLRDGK